METPGLEVAPLCALLVGGSVAALLLLALRWNSLKRRTLDKMDRARQRRQAALEHMERAVQHFRQENPGVNSGPILSLSLVQLTEKIQNGSLSPESVLYTYIEKALEVHKDVNCLTNFLPECEAQLQDAKKQDNKGPLYGVPISLKDNFNYKGHDSSMGLVNFLDRPISEDCVVVQVLKKQGAVPFVKTNIPQSMLNYDCSNLIFGQTVNPMDHRKSPGGSSGGEGALISSGGSILGLGSDVAGSIRIPSSFCGICGFKPTRNRLSMRGVSTSAPGQKTVISMLGPLARDVDSVALCMRALLCDDMFRLDPTVPPIPFNEEVYSSPRPLRVGYYETDGFAMPSPSMRRAVLEMKLVLEKAGHTLVAFTPPNIEYATIELGYKGLMSDGGDTFLDKFKGDLIDPNLKDQIQFYRTPRVMKTLLSIIAKPLFPRFSLVCRTLRGLGSAKEVLKHHAEVEEYRQEFIAKWKELDLDVMLCPVPSPAFTIGYPGKLSVAVSYTILYNLLDFPAGVVPATLVTTKDEEELKHYKGHYQDPWDKLFPKAVEGSVGLPVAVQCVALPWQEELCLRFMKEVETLAHLRN
ncbi:vitamin D3 hydroxylase-associated protein-like [Lissotriton helveticus]